MSDTLPDRLYLNTRPPETIAFDVPTPLSGFGRAVAAGEAARTTKPITDAHRVVGQLEQSGEARLPLPMANAVLALTLVPGCDPPTRGSVREAVRAAVEAVRRG